MSTQDIKVKVTYVSRADLESLIMRFGKIRVEAEKGEIIYFENVSNHDTYRQYDYKHVFETTIFRNGEKPIWGTVTLTSKDNEIFTGLIEYTKHFGGPMAESH